MTIHNMQTFLHRCQAPPCGNAALDKTPSASRSSSHCISPSATMSAFLLPTASAKPFRRATTAALVALSFHLLPAHARPPPSTTLAHNQLSTLSQSAPSSIPSISQTDINPPLVIFDRDFTPSPLWSPPSRTLPPKPPTTDELRILLRLLVALVVGGFIGMERRAANSLAGVRTFSLVSLGAAIFMTTTLLAFPYADPCRVAAAISSSVGFLGAGAMQKNNRPRGLTTASSVWLAAALGIAAACGLFLLSFAGAVSTVLIARYARFDSSLHLIRGDPLGDWEGWRENGVAEWQEVDYDPSSDEREEEEEDGGKRR